MVISNLNIPRIVELLRYMESCLQELKPFSIMTVEEFLSDRKNPPFVQSYLDRFTKEIVSFIRAYEEKRKPQL